MAQLAMISNKIPGSCPGARDGVPSERRRTSETRVYLLRAAPEQLRHASPRETLIEELNGPVEIPWTMTALATNPRRRTYQDISRDIPDEAEWEDAADHPAEPVDPALEVPRFRLREKRGVASRPVQDRPSSKEPKTMERRGTKRAGEAYEAARVRPPLRAVGSRESHPPEEEEMALRAVEIHIEMPDSKQGMKKLTANPAAFFCQKLKRKQVEVCERRLTEEQRKEFESAKDSEVRNFVASECFKAWKGPDAPEEEILGMRWLLTWKYDEKYKDMGGRKAKARAIILGYHDPNYAARETSSPTPSKAGRQLFFQFCSWKKFTIKKGDVSGALLRRPFGRKAVLQAAA